MKKKESNNQKTGSFSKKLLSSVSTMLTNQLKRLERRKKEISKEDPFKNVDRVTENTSLDDTATEQFGHAQVEALKEQLDKQIVRVRKALTMIKIGKYGVCDDCGKMIETKRLMFEPEATFCMKCQAKREK
jgi:RNA polymerase-binding transcription factor DksA